MKESIRTSTEMVEPLVCLLARILSTSSAFCPELTQMRNEVTTALQVAPVGSFQQKQDWYWPKVLVGASPTERASVGNSNRCFDALHGAGVFTET
jgi:hypothetical protein